jgi:hypothetical protein
MSPCEPRLTPAVAVPVSTTTHPVTVIVSVPEAGGVLGRGDDGDSGCADPGAAGAGDPGTAGGREPGDGICGVGL